MKGTKEPEFHLETSQFKNNNNTDIVTKILSSKFDSSVRQVELSSVTRKETLVFRLNPADLVREVLSENHENLKDHSKKTILVEFSSPNIAKPFHVGHLRSTIIGNFISNIHEHYSGDKVVRINYLGDWGTQFGLLNVGLDLLCITDDQIAKSPIKTLFEAYVHANCAAEKDVILANRARQIFNDLENSSGDDLAKWQKIREYTIAELAVIYKRLGVRFDVYDWESNYRKLRIEHIFDLLTSKGLLETEPDGKQIVVVGNDHLRRRVPIVKSDGTTLYLTRDLGAIENRHQTYNFDRAFYVVDNGQTDHFKALSSIGRSLAADWADRFEHIKFGRIKGMSTRRGTVVFLRDILDEARDIMRKKQIQSPTTKVNMADDDRTADILGITAVVINDLKQRRQRDYDFDWNKVLQVTGDTGIKLQYTHCRLCSLLKIEGGDDGRWQPETVDIKYLQEPEALSLVYELGRFEEVLYATKESLEACILVNYLFCLCNSTSRALKVLNVKNEQSTDIKSHRLILFRRANQVLGRGMKILGLQPLEEM